jgi:ABC-type branched-subunit amino acid transport system substrate-binding protein
VAGFPWDPTRKSARLERFRKAYHERFGVEADTYAAHAYDGMNLMLWAIQVAGLNRAKIRDVVAHLPHPWPGVTGEVVFSACLDDVGDTTLASFENGAWVYRTRQQLQVPRGYIPPRDRLNRDSDSAQAQQAGYGGGKSASRK